MGLQNHNANITFVRVKDGKFYLTKDGEPYDELYGQITKLSYKDETYEGQPQRKLILVITDQGENHQFGINVESGNYSSITNFLSTVDVSKPLTLHPRNEKIKTADGKEVSRGSILISQNGQYAKGYFSKANPRGIPAWNIVQVGNKKVVDKTDYLAFLEKHILTNVATKLTDAAEATEAPKATGTVVQKKEAPTVDTSFDTTEGEVVNATPWD